MAQEVNVDFGSFSISSYLDKNLELVVSTSALLSAPVQCPDTFTAADLRDQVRNGSLWIAQGGSCHIELRISFGGSLNGGSREDMQRMCVEAFENFPVWGALGLDLRRDYNLFNELRGSRSLYPYLVRHIRPNSSLITPDQVPCAYLSTLTCNFTFASKGTPANMLQHITTDEVRDTQIGNSRMSPRKSPASVAKRHQTHSMNQSMSLPRKLKVVTLKAPPSELRRILGVPEICSLPLGLQEKRLEHLTHTALHLVFGPRKRFAGIQILRKPGSPTALEVAPAVWSSRYLQDVVSRAQLASFVASALGNLMSTGSTTVQHKMQRLGLDPLQEIHQRTIRLLLRSARVPKLQVHARKPGSQSKVAADPLRDNDGVHESQHDIQEREPRGTKLKDESHDDTSSQDEAEMEACYNDSDLAHSDVCLYGNTLKTRGELALENGVAYPSSSPSISHPIPEDLEEIRGFAHYQLLNGGHNRDRAAFCMQNDDYRELQQAAIDDDMDEVGAEDPMEGLVGVAYRNFEHELYHERGSRQNSVDGTLLYGDAMDSEDYHPSYLDAEPAYESENPENREDEHGNSDYWPEYNLMMRPADLLPSSGPRPSQIGYDDSHMNVHYDTDHLDYTMGQSGTFEADHQYEDLCMYSEDDFIDEAAALMTLGREEPDDAESVIYEPCSDDAGDFCRHDGDGEDLTPSEDTPYSMEMSRSSILRFGYSKAGRTPRSASDFHAGSLSANALMDSMSTDAMKHC